MIVTLKLYAPMLLLLFWAVVFAVSGGQVLAVIGLVTLAAATKVQVSECRRQQRKRRY